MSPSAGDALTVLERACSELSARAADDRATLASIKQSAAEVARIESGRAYSSLFADLLLALDRLGSEKLSEELRDSVIEEILDDCARYGLSAVDETGTLNLRNQEVVGTVEASMPEEDGTIVEVVRAGYLVGGELLRPARVVVARYSPED